MSQLLLRSIVRVLASLLVTAFVVVPTIMRARQHVELRDSTSLSIRLNWTSDAPPQKEFLVPSPELRKTTDPIAVVEPPGPLRLVPGVQSAADILVRRTAFHNAPDLFRGPPSLFL
jgi:hypothetical protein